MPTQPAPDPTHLLPERLRSFDPIRQLAMAPEEALTEPLIAALLPHAVARWREDVQASGWPSWNVRSAVARTGDAGIEALAPWLATASDRVLIACLGALSDLFDGPARPVPPAAPPAALSASARDACRRATTELRRHLPAPLPYRLLLEVDAIDGTFAPGSRRRVVRVTCHQSLFAGMVVKTPYTVAVRRKGEVVVGSRPRTWPVAPEAMAGLMALVSAPEPDPLSRGARPRWAMVFESAHRDTVRKDWRDGREALTAVREGLSPGVVREVRPWAEGDDALRKVGLQPLLPTSSGLHGRPLREVELARTTCAAMEARLAT